MFNLDLCLRVQTWYTPFGIHTSIVLPSVLTYSTIVFVPDMSGEGTDETSQCTVVELDKQSVPNFSESASMLAGRLAL